MISTWKVSISNKEETIFKENFVITSFKSSPFSKGFLITEK